MSTKDKDWQGAFESAATGSRAREAGSGRSGVSVSKETIDDGAEMTKVSHPPRYLRNAGQLKQALEAGVIDLDEFKERCIEGMNATKAVPTGGGQVVYEADFPTRLNYLKFITETVEGMPVKRQEIVSRTLTTTEDLEKKLAAFPALRKTLLTQLQKIEYS